MSIAKIDKSIAYLDGDIFYYNELISSITEAEKPILLNELDSTLVTTRAEKLQEELSKLEMVVVTEKDTRTLFLAALRGVKKNQISAAQLATLHVIDSAVQSLYFNPIMFIIHKYVDSEENLQDLFGSYSINDSFRMPNKVRSSHYKRIFIPIDGIDVNKLPWRMRMPLIKRFFNLTESEWQVFCKDIDNAPESEQFYCILNAPVQGCWSGITSKIQKHLKCMRVLDWMVDSNKGMIIENIMVVPSFSMFQAALNAKAHTLKRNPIQLVPTYGYVVEEHYTRLKKSGKMPFTLYLPERISDMRYNFYKGGYRTTIDGHPSETAFAGAIHDVYHAMREMSMSENVAKARMRFVDIAKAHPNNRTTPESRPVDNFLIDGELIYSYPPDVDTMFDPEFRSEKAEIFGEIFYSKADLHENLKRSFIEDMVTNKSMWQDEFSLGRVDLLSEDQDIYDEIERNQRKSVNKDDDNFSAVEAINTIGLLSNFHQARDATNTSNTIYQP